MPGHSPILGKARKGLAAAAAAVSPLYVGSPTHSGLEILG
jgi:hypothetical protein